MTPPRHVRRIAAAIGLGAAIAVTGCAGGPSRPELTDAELVARQNADLAEMQAAFGGAITKMIERVDERGAAGEDTTINLLAMSGGGDYGAFGAGFLVGWGSVEDPGWRRPDFDGVTGVSTGALLAPFAYVGTDEALRTVESFYRNPKKDWVRSRGMLFFLPKNSSFMTIPGLKRDLASVFDGPFIDQMAEQSRRGKVLVVSATDLDFGRQRFWEVGHEAEEAAAAGDPARVQNILLASAAIPALFPPIEIGDSIYGDGGVTANVFLRLEAHNPGAFIPRWKAANPGKTLPKLRYWIIVNNQVTHVPKVVQPRWPAIIGPSLETSIRSATLAEIRWLAAEVDYVNQLLDTDIEVRVVAIPDDWRAPVKGDFQQETMISLSELGRTLGADPKSWQVWAAPRKSGSPPASAPAR